MWEGNREQTRTAPVVALVAYDLEFYQKADKLTPKGNPEQVKARLQNNPLMAEHLAKQSGTLQGAYLIMAARALGLDAGPMGGFDADKINQEFFAGTSLRINFVCNLGYGERDSLHSRLARLDFEEAVTVL
jgi:nitroreductase